MVSCYKDKTFCASPNCKNECGRKMTEHEKLEAIIDDMPVCYGYFCGAPNEFYEAGKKVMNKYAKALEGLKDK